MATALISLGSVRERDRLRIGFLFALGAALSFAAMGTMAKAAYMRGATPLGLLAVRMIVGALVWGLILAPRLRSVSWSAQVLRWLALAAILGGLGAGLSELLAYEYLPVAVVVLVLFLNPIWLLLATRVLYRRSIELLDLVAIALVLSGMFLLVGGAAGRLSTTGLLLAGLASVLSLFLYLGMERGARSLGAPISAAVVSWIACPVIVALAAGTGDLAPMFSNALLGWGLALGLLTSVVGLTLMASAVIRLGPFETSVVAAAEPPLAAAIAWIFLQEQLTQTQILGASLIVLGVLVVQGGAIRRRKRLGTAVVMASRERGESG